MTMEIDDVRQRLSGSLVQVLHDEFTGDRRAVLLFQQFVHAAAYSREFVLLLTAVARGRHSDSWEIRLLAALMLQKHLLNLDVDNISEFRFVLDELGLRTEDGLRLEICCHPF